MHYLNALNSGETAEVLIAHGADVGARIREGSWVEGATPLHKAAGRLYDSPDLIRVLLAHGADVNARTDVGKGNSIKSGASPLYFAADRGNIESAKLLIRAGADLNIQDGQGWTPLHLACYRGRAAMVALLAESGANTNLLDHNGQTPLHLAAWQGSVSMVEVLLKHGADPNIAGKWGKPGKHASAAVKKILTRYGGTDD